MSSPLWPWPSTFPTRHRVGSHRGAQGSGSHKGQGPSACCRPTRPGTLTLTRPDVWFGPASPAALASSTPPSSTCSVLWWGYSPETGGRGRHLSLGGRGPATLGICPPLRLRRAPIRGLAAPRWPVLEAASVPGSSSESPGNSQPASGAACRLKPAWKWSAPARRGGLGQLPPGKGRPAAWPMAAGSPAPCWVLGGLGTQQLALPGAGWLQHLRHAEGEGAWRPVGPLLRTQGHPDPGAARARRGLGKPAMAGRTPWPQQGPLLRLFFFFF